MYDKIVSVKQILTNCEENKMTLKDKLKTDLTTNLKAHNDLAVLTLRNLLGTIATQEKAGKTSVIFDDVAVEKVLTAEVKKRRDTAKIYADANVLDRAERETLEADFIAQYLPEQLTDTEVETIVDEVLKNFTEPTMKDFGQIMKAVTAETKNLADGKTISNIVRNKIS